MGYEIKFSLEGRRHLSTKRPLGGLLLDLTPLCYSLNPKLTKYNNLANIKTEKKTLMRFSFTNLKVDFQLPWQYILLLKENAFLICTFFFSFMQ